MALWTPAEIETTAWWDSSDQSTIFNASDEVVVDGEAVLRREDKSGNGWHQSQTDSSTRRPIWSDGVVGSRGALAFNADALSTAAVSSALVRHVFVVAIATQVPQPDDFATIVNQVDAGFNNDPWLIGTTGAGTGGKHDRLRTVINSSGVDFDFIQTFVDTAMVVSEPFLAGYRNDGTGVFSYNFVESTFPSAGQHNTQAKPINSGAQAESGVLRNLWRGYDCEVVIAGGELTAGNRYRIEGYLAHKWALAAKLPASHPYKSAPPTLGNGRLRLSARTRSRLPVRL